MKNNLIILSLISIIITFLILQISIEDVYLIKIKDALSNTYNLVASISIIFIAHTYFHQKLITNENRKNNLRNKTLEYCREFVTPDTMKYFDLLRSLNEKQKHNIENDIEAFKDYLIQDSNLEYRVALTYILNLFETISLNYYKENLDKEIMTESFKNVFVTTYKKFQNYIISKQQINCSSWKYYSRLIKEWDN